VVVSNPDRPPVNSDSRVVLSAHDLVMTYAARVGQADVPIASCHANLTDVATVRTMNTAATPYLYVAFKPSHPAHCQSGPQPIALVPIANDSAASDAVAAINRACCGAAGPPAKVAVVARYVPSPTPTPAPVQRSTAVPAGSPAPASSAAAHMLVTDWVESDGLFTFIRVRNRGPQSVTISSGQVDDCRAVAVGCGPFARSVTVAPGAADIVATVMSADPVNDSSFSYRYVARSAAATGTGSGTSRKQLNGWKPALSVQEMRSAQAAAIASFRVSSPSTEASGSQVPLPANVPARLTQRGSSRLAIGHTGEARVRVRISAKGVPLNASIVSVSNQALVAAALETAVSSTYAPAIRDGRPVDEDYVATFQFDGQDPALSSIPVWKRPLSSDASPGPSPGPT
jgi:hypothetical protein